MRLFIYVAFIFYSSLNSSFAGDFENFIGDRIFTTDKKNCSEEGRIEPRGLYLDAGNIIGYEFGCTFLQSWRDVDAQNTELSMFVVLANCGDDSGFNRPDMFTIIQSFPDDPLTVTSQNEYTAMMAHPDADDAEDRHLFASGEYELCRSDD